MVAGVPIDRLIAEIVASGYSAALPPEDGAVRRMGAQRPHGGRGDDHVIGSIAVADTIRESAAPSSLRGTTR